MLTGFAVGSDLDGGPVRIELHATGLRTLKSARAVARGVLEQHEVELVALHLIGVRPGGVEAAIETEEVVAALVIGREIRAQLLTPISSSRSYRPSRWMIGIFIGSSDSPMWKRGCRSRSISVDGEAFPGEQGRNGRARRAAAYDQHVAGDVQACRRTARWLSRSAGPFTLWKLMLEFSDDKLKRRARGQPGPFREIYRV